VFAVCREVSKSKKPILH